MTLASIGSRGVRAAAALLLAATLATVAGCASDDYWDDRDGVSGSVSVGVGYGGYYGPGYYPGYYPGGGYYDPYPPVVVVPPDRPGKPDRPTTLPAYDAKPSPMPSTRPSSTARPTARPAPRPAPRPMPRRR